MHREWTRLDSLRTAGIAAISARQKGHRLGHDSMGLFDVVRVPLGAVAVLPSRDRTLRLEVLCVSVSRSGHC